MDYALAVDILLPAADFRRADSYQSLLETWKDERPIPSESEINAAWAEIETAQSLIAARKVWSTVADFYAEFTPAEKYLIQSSNIPAIVVARGDLTMWRGEMWSDNVDVLAGLDAMIEAGVITAERKTEILTGAAQ